MRSNSVTPEALRFLTPVREFTLHNSTDEAISFMYDGETRVVPSSKDIVYPHPKFADVCHSAQDEDGDYIPGTIVLKDVIAEKEFGQYGETDMVWSASNAIKHCLEIDVSSGIASGSYAKRGLSLLPPNPSKELVKEVAEYGRDRYFDWKVAEAKSIVESYDEKTQARQRVGMNAVPPGRDYDKALVVLNRAKAKDDALLEKSFASAPKAPVVVEDKDDEISDDALATLIAEKVAAISKSVGVDKAALVEAVTSDPEAMRILKQSHKVRKHREKKDAASL